MSHDEPGRAPIADIDEAAQRPLPTYSVIQQQLINARDQLDREVVRLTRMHAFNARALRLTEEGEFIQAVGEAVVDIFELEFGICWRLDESGTIGAPVGMLGIQLQALSLHEVGTRLAALLTPTTGTQARILARDDLTHIAPDLAIGQAIVATCCDSEGQPLALLLGGNTLVGVDFFESVTAELGQAFGLFAQQLGALMENRRGRAIIERQIAELRRADQRLRLALDSNKAGLWDLDLANGSVELSSGWTSLTGEESGGRVVTRAAWIEQMPSADQNRMNSLLAAVHDGRQGQFELIHRLRHRDGNLHWVLSRGHPQYDDGGQPVRVLGTTFDFSRQRALEEELERERGFLRTLIGAIPDLVWLKDPDGVYLACNPKFERLYGATEREIVGKTDYDFVDRELADFFRTRDRAAMAAAAPCVNEEELVFAADGHHELVETIKTPLYDTQGQLIGVLGVARDITQRRQTEEQIRKLSRAVEQSPSSIVITDLDANIEYVNDAFVQATGYSRAEVIGRNPRVLQSGKTPKASFDTLWQALTQGQTWQGEFHNRRRDGSEYDEFAIIAPIRQSDGRITHYLAIKEDISEKKRNAAELDRHRHHLMDLVTERTLELAQAKDAAEMANRAKSTFLANMSHEIRTPMNAIIGLTHLLMRDPQSEAQLERLRKISKSASHLLAVLNDILDISKIESEKLVLDHTPFALQDVIDNLESLIAERLHAKNLRFVVDLDELPGSLVGDRMRLSQILLNYLGNALKFTESGVITLRARIVEAGGDTLLLRFEVADTGIGIDETARMRLFQAFEQADNSTTRIFGGTGLGLAINKRLAHLMGGEVGVASEPGRGSTFWATVRLGKAESPDLAGTGEGDAGADDNRMELAIRRDFPHARILLAEDDLINQEVALELLRDDAGLQTDLAVNGAQAVTMAATTAYDIILMDMQMPVMDGAVATRAIRRLPTHAETPILAMTANAFDEDRQVCLDAGMNDHIAKPVDPDRLFEVLYSWLKRAAENNCHSPKNPPCPPGN